MRRSTRVLSSVLAGWLVLTGPAAAGAWCDVVFKDVALEAAVVALGRVAQLDAGPARVEVVDVLKGDCDRSVLTLDPEDFDSDSVRVGDHLLLALDRDLQPLQSARGLGFCSAISVLPIRGGKLRARERVNYDSERQKMTLDEIRDELSRWLADGSSAAR